MTSRYLSVWPQLGPDLYLSRAQERLPYPLDDPNCRLFPSGYDAIVQGVRQLGLGPGDEVLVPAYHQRSEIEALVRAGVAPRSYDSDDRLEPVEEQLSAQLTPKTRAMQLTHYFGFPQDAARWRQWCDARGLLLIEGVSQAWLSSDSYGPVGSLGDLAVFCLHHTVATPRAAALIFKAPPPPEESPTWGAFPIMRSHAAWLLSHSPLPHPALSHLDRRAHGLGSETGRENPGRSIAKTTAWLLHRLCEPGIAARRRANFEFLLDRLGDRVWDPFDLVPAEACPFVFPLRVGDKEEVLERLSRQGVLGLDIWSSPHGELHPGDERRRLHTIGLPVHHELRPADLERIVAATGRGARPVARLSVERLPDVGAAGAEWQALAERADNIFATPEWLTSWWRHFGRGEQRILGCRRANGNLAAVIPLYRSSIGPARTLRYLGHGPSDQLGPICDPAERAAVARALRRGLRDGLVGEWDLLVSDLSLGEYGWSALLGGTVLRHESSPLLRARGRSFEEVLASRSSNFRQQVRRRERKLSERHDLRYRLVDDPGRLQEDLTVLFDLHAARWSSGESDAFSPQRQVFHREFAAVALDRGWLRFWLAEVDGCTVAALYGFRFAGSELYYQSGRDPRWDPYAVGFVLLAHAIRAALDDGADQYRLLRGDEPYKARFADYDPGLETFVTARGRPARVAMAFASPLLEHDRPQRWLRRAALRSD